ncbi:Receptor-interacting serine/threonine-protein kinase 1 [Actinomortierella ambigua]|nr:Receptor-interacting serine/threonine-protein kinase 1 [Actinomortierella ambigua]
MKGVWYGHSVSSRPDRKKRPEQSSSFSSPSSSLPEQPLTQLTSEEATLEDKNRSSTAHGSPLNLHVRNTTVAGLTDSASSLDGDASSPRPAPGSQQAIIEAINLKRRLKEQQQQQQQLAQNQKRQAQDMSEGRSFFPLANIAPQHLYAYSPYYASSPHIYSPMAGGSPKSSRSEHTTRYPQLQFPSNVPNYAKLSGSSKSSPNGDSPKYPQLLFPESTLKKENAQSTSSTSGVTSGFKIRIPRDLPNLPDVFRKRGAIRSTPTSAAATPASSTSSPSASIKSDADYTKRKHSAIADESSAPAEKRLKIGESIKPTLRIPPHLLHSTKLAIRSGFGSQSTATATASAVASSQGQGSSATSSKERANAEAGSQHEPILIRVPAPKAKTKLKSKHFSRDAPPARVPTPPATSSTSSSSAATTQSTKERSSSPARLHASTSPSAAADSGVMIVLPMPSNEADAMSVDSSSNSNLPLEPLKIIRIGMEVLNLLWSDPVCKSFINKVPLAETNYHVVIKKPMDLRTVEERLWRRLDSGSAASGQDTYTTLGDFERDLRRIHQNATFFNATSHPIYLEAQQYQACYKKAMTPYLEGPLPDLPPDARELYRADQCSLSEPGSLYIFRAHNLREMERKMTVASAEFFATFHQPLFEASTEKQELSPENPRFLRMFINKNRSLLSKCVSEPQAKIAIFTDMHVGKAYADEVTGNSVVRIRARVVIAKPLGRRHDMVSVIDLDCPTAWVTAACVKALDIDVVVPSKFEKGTLSKMRHEVIPFTGHPKLTFEEQEAFAEALGVTIPHPSKTRASAVAAAAAASRVPAEITPPMTREARSNLALANRAGSATSMNARGKKGGRGTTRGGAGGGAGGNGGSGHSRESSMSMVEVDNQPESGRLLVRFRLPALKTSASPSSPSPLEERVASVETPASSTSTTTAITSKLAATGVTDFAKESSPSISEQGSLASEQSPDSSALPSTQEELGAMSSLAIDAHQTTSQFRAPMSQSLTKREQQLLRDLKTAAKAKNVPYMNWNTIEPTLTIDSAHGLFKRIYHVRGQEGLVVQNFKEMDSESFEQRVREVACLLKLRDLEGVGQIQAVIDDEDDQLVGLSMTKYAFTLKAYATNPRRHPTPAQKLSLIRDMVSAMCSIHGAGLAHRDLSEVNIMVDEDAHERLSDNSARPKVRVIDFGKSVFVQAEEVKRWSMVDHVPEDELALLPKVILPPDHGYKLYRSILTLPRNKYDHQPLPPVDPRLEDMYSLGVLIWRVFSGKSPWNGAIEDDLKTIRYLVSSDEQIRFQLEREVQGLRSREMLLRCLTAEAETRWTAAQLQSWLDQPEVLEDLLREFEELGGGRKKVRKNLD